MDEQPKTTSRIDLNADLAESFGVYTLGDEAALMATVTSASLAAGFHAGDPTVLRASIRLARASGTAIGAHPGLPDLVGFGRREINVTPSDAEDLVLYQIAAVAGVADAEGLSLQHVKLHGALYNMAARDLALARAVARAVVAINPSLVLFGPPGSALLTAAREAGLSTAAEGFADRAYQADGSLVSRTDPRALIHNAEMVVERAVRMVKDKTVVALDGSVRSLEIDTLCIHGDTPGAPRLASQLRAGLEAAGIAVQAVGVGVR